VIDTLSKQEWCPFGLSVVVRDGIVHLSGVITEERARQAAIVAAENITGVKKIHDHLCWVDAMSGMYLDPPGDEDHAKAS
jgi:BON domain-containing protein